MFTLQTISGKIGQSITVEGFVHAVRLQSKVSFIILRSGSEYIQCVIGTQLKEKLKGLLKESYVAATGTLVSSTFTKEGVELHAQSLEIVPLLRPWPIGEKSEIGVKLEWPVARFREHKEALILKAQSQIEWGLMSFLQQRGFCALHSPKIIGAPSESGAECFELSYFKQKAYLAQSPQFYKQMAIIAGLQKIYESSSVFRQEPSFSSRHATEFVSFDLEMEGVKSEYDLVALECEMLRSALAYTLSSMGPELTSYYPKATLPGPEKVMTFKEAQIILGLSGSESLSAEQERQLGSIMLEEGFELIALTQVPYAQRPFYHMKEEQQPELTRSFELLYRGVELTTGAVREHRYEKLITQMKEKELTGKGMEFYLESFQLGAPPHGGLGLGLTRLVMLFLGLPGIKEASFIHRGPERLTP